MPIFDGTLGESNSQIRAIRVIRVIRDSDNIPFQKPNLPFFVMCGILYLQGGLWNLWHH